MSNSVITCPPQALLPFSLSRRTRVAIEGLGAGAAATVTMQVGACASEPRVIANFAAVRNDGLRTHAVVCSAHGCCIATPNARAARPWPSGYTMDGHYEAYLAEGGWDVVVADAPLGCWTPCCCPQEGVRGLYRGFGVSVLTYFPASAIVWSSFAWLSDVLNNWLPDPAAGNDIAGGAHAAKTVARDLAISGGAGTQVAALARRLMAGTIPLDSPCDDLGGIAGCMSAVATNGADVLRTRVQTTGVVANTSVRAAARALWREEGLAGFMRGVTARMLIAAPTTVLSMALYDAVKRVAFAAQKQQA